MSIRWNVILILMLTVAFSASDALEVNAHARINTDFYSHLPVKDLFDKATGYSRKQMPDSALACYIMCGLRYQPSLPQEELELTINAMRKEAQLYFYTYYDYETACNRLAEAMALCKLHKLDNILLQMLMEQGGVYFTYAYQNPAPELLQKGEELYRQAFSKGYEMGDTNVMTNAFANLVSHYHGSDRLEEMKPEIELFGNTVANDSSGRYLYAIILYRGMVEILNGNHTAARNTFLGKDSGKLHPRQQFKLIVSAVRSFLKEDNIDSAIILEQRLLDMCDKYDIREGKAIVLRDLGNLYLSAGDTALSQKFTLLGLQSKDTLINVNHLDKAANIAFLEEMHMLHEKAAYSKRRSDVMITIIIGLLLTIVVSATVWAKINRRHHEAMTNAAKALDALNKTTGQTPRADTSGPEAADDSKYQSSCMDEFTCQVLTKRIQEVFSLENEVIYTQGFSIDDVARIVKSNSRYVSQIINQTFGCNFATLLSTLRVREAARRIADNGTYGNMTFEAIGSSVGFGSRAAFNAAFKRLTGKTPRDYRNSLTDSRKKM